MFRNTILSTSDALLLFDAGAGQVQGRRPFQEDRCTFVLPDQFPSQTNDKLTYFAVYDGHGSELVSDHASRDLHLLLAKRPEFDQGDYEAAIRGALIDEDAVLLDTFNNLTTEPAVSGSTVALCFVNLTKGDLVVANLGDSHVILAERDNRTDHPSQIRRLSKSHKPDTPDEKARIEDAGGAVNTRRGTARLAQSYIKFLTFAISIPPGSLNMSRALGDLQYKNPINNAGDEYSSSKTRRASATTSAPETRGNFLSVEPHMTRMTLSPDRRYLVVVTSDGVSDNIDDATLIHHVMRLSMRGMRAGDIAQEIATTAAAQTAKGGSDNASCIVALLDGQNT
ncbi:PP2C family serine/threonine-protein phosphatase [Aspergillus novofumigatus IBT 16806]|uniref:protein-serine/threonine phosphatase n=1 Tax=Aspergillus novofumigatus (strain IBT 16806) TaxID=1392255 RepID=A0A2I1CL17_ASPN1|nr:protein serine/threonine phosphatase 2C [Aspergillus novofumigatus IBT 16806]PKX98312.1 protein serine/threonine phosphatase 2C [Aspergillus novofumigatus IBT 16806]